MMKTRFLGAKLVFLGESAGGCNKRCEFVLAAEQKGAATDDTDHTDGWERQNDEIRMTNDEPKIRVSALRGASSLASIERQNVCESQRSIFSGNRS
jgi:hypothetical protein